MNRQIIFATSNENKMKEIRMILSDLKIDIVSLKEAGIQVDVEENGETFEENAIIKAKTIMELTGKIVLADDSGLEVDYMDKQPGIHSARFMGRDTSYSIKNQAIIDKLEHAVDNARSARFVCVIAAAFPDGRIITTRATTEGQIAYQIQGNNGFGYDAIMYLPEYQKTMAQLEPEQKNAISHRGKALRLMREKIKEEIE